MTECNGVPPEALEMFEDIIPQPRRPVTLRPATPLLRAFIFLWRSGMYQFGMERYPVVSDTDLPFINSVTAITNNQFVNGFITDTVIFVSWRVNEMVLRTDRIQRSANRLPPNVRSSWQITDINLERLIPAFHNNAVVGDVNAQGLLTLGALRKFIVQASRYPLHTPMPAQLAVFDPLYAWM